MKRLALVIAASILAASACKDDVVALNPGILQVNLTTPNTGLDGAAVVMISGPAVPRSVNPTAGLKLWGGPMESPQELLALTGTLHAGTILTIEVNDISAAAQYSASLRAVSTSDSTVALRDLTGYSLAVVR